MTIYVPQRVFSGEGFLNVKSAYAKTECGHSFYGSNYALKHHVRKLQKNRGPLYRIRPDIMFAGISDLVGHPHLPVFMECSADKTRCRRAGSVSPDFAGWLN